MTDLFNVLSQRNQKMFELTKQFPNDQDLGREVRKFVNQILEQLKEIKENELDKKSNNPG